MRAKNNSSNTNQNLVYRNNEMSPNRTNNYCHEWIESEHKSRRHTDVLYRKAKNK